MADSTPPSPADAVKPSSKKTLGIPSLAMINVAAVLSLRNFPTMAMEGWNMIFWYVLFTVCFLIPTALVAAELASTWPKSGGIYSWVKEAYPKNGSFIIIWCSWVNNLVWFPTVVSFFAATVAYILLAPLLSDNPVFMALVMLACFWAVTIFNFFGSRASNLLATVGTALESLIPVGILVVLMILWVTDGNPSAIGDFSVDRLIPHFDLSIVTFAASIVLMFAGMEMAGYHARETANPRRDYPIAMFLAAAIICIVSIVGTLAVALVVPADQIALNAGIVQTFQVIFTEFHLGWLIVPVSIMLAVGIIAQLSVWLVGPAKGMLPAAMSGDLPPIFRKMNKYGIPVGVLIVQGIVSSAFALAMVLVPSINQGYWVLTAITALINAVMYIVYVRCIHQTLQNQRQRHPPVQKSTGRKDRHVAGCARRIRRTDLLLRRRSVPKRNLLHADRNDSLCHRHAYSSPADHSPAAVSPEKVLERFMETDKTGVPRLVLRRTCL